MDRQSPIPTIPSIVPETDDLAGECMSPPARRFSHPDEILNDDSLDTREKRAILSSWASDAWAVESVPTLRHPPEAAKPVPLKQIMSALCRLDRISSHQRIGHQHTLGRLDA